MEHTSVSSLVVVLIIAFLTPILLHRFRLSIPVVVAEIIMGLIIGKSGFDPGRPARYMARNFIDARIYLFNVFKRA
jgi:Kef-type K+ transport system membrane component KefB